MSQTENAVTSSFESKAVCAQRCSRLTLRNKWPLLQENVLHNKEIKSFVQNPLKDPHG